MFLVLKLKFSLPHQLVYVTWKKGENFKRQDRIMSNLVDGEQTPEDFGRRISDLFFRKSSLAAVKKNDYIFKSFLNYSYYDTLWLKSITKMKIMNKMPHHPSHILELRFCTFPFFHILHIPFALLVYFGRHCRHSIMFYLCIFFYNSICK